MTENSVVQLRIKQQSSTEVLNGPVHSVQYMWSIQYILLHIRFNKARCNPVNDYTFNSLLHCYRHVVLHVDHISGNMHVPFSHNTSKNRTTGKFTF